MRLKGEAYSRRLEEYSTSTLRLISKVDTTSKKLAIQSTAITTNSELTEEQVVAQLKELLKEHGAKDLANKKGELK